MSSAIPDRFIITGPVDILALIPYLLGYHPSDQVVAAGIQQSTLTFIASGPLPEPGTPVPQIDALVEQLAVVVGRQHINAAILIGYGTAERVDPILSAAGPRFAARRVALHDALRVTDGHYFAPPCTDPSCSDQGVPFDAASSALAAQATVAGLVALPDRAAFAARVAPVSGQARTGMLEATRRAQARLAKLLPAAADTTDPTSVDPDLAEQLEARLRQIGQDAVAQAFDRYQHGGRLSDDEAAWLSLLLVHPPVRDLAWRLTGEGDEHLALWTDLTRRIVPELAAAPASLLAFTAYRRGDGALANVALDRAQQADPSYRLARLLADLLQRGVPPSAWEGWPDLLEQARDERSNRRDQPTDL